MLQSIDYEVVWVSLAVQITWTHSKGFVCRVFEQPECMGGTAWSSPHTRKSCVKILHLCRIYGAAMQILGHTSRYTASKKANTQYAACIDTREAQDHIDKA